MEKSQREADEAAVGREGAEGFFRRDEARIDLGGNQHAAVGEDGYPFPGPGAELVEKGADALILLHERLSASDRGVDVVCEPFLQMRIRDFIEQFHLPFPEIDLQDARVSFGVGITTESSQPGATGQGACVGMVDGAAGFQGGFRHCGLFLEGLFQRNVGLPVAGADRYIGHGMAEKDYIHVRTVTR